MTEPPRHLLTLTDLDRDDFWGLIDKARIRDTGERLTQPGFLAVVYSQSHEALCYTEAALKSKAMSYFVRRNCSKD